MNKTVGIWYAVWLHFAFLVLAAQGESWAPREAMRYCYHYATLVAHPDPRQTCLDCCARYLPAGCPSVCLGLATATTAVFATMPVPATTHTTEIGRRRQIAWTFGSASAATNYCYRWSGLFPQDDPLGHCRTCCGQHLTVREQLATCYTSCAAGYASTTTLAPTTEFSATAAAAKRLLLVPDMYSPIRLTASPLTACFNRALMVFVDETFNLHSCYACCDDTILYPLEGSSLLPIFRIACHHECDALDQRFASVAGSA